MRTRLPHLLAGLAIAAASLVAASPADAHATSNYAFLACAWDRPTTDFVVDHAHFKWGNDIAHIYGCVVHDLDTQCKYDAVGWFSRGRLVAITGPYNGRCVEDPI